MTSAFTRPPAHPALDFNDVRLAGSEAASSTGGKQHGGGASVSAPAPATLAATAAAAAAAAEGGGDADGVGSGDHTEPPANPSSTPEQVHLLPRGPGEVTVVWATAVAVEPDAVVRFGRVKPDGAPHESENAGKGGGEDGGEDDAMALTLEAAVMSTAYTAQICLGEPNNLQAVMGNMHPVSLTDLTYLANTSRWAPREAANYHVIDSPADVVPPTWFETKPWSKAICLPYSNPDAQYQSPLINAAHMGAAGTGLAPGATYRYFLPGDSHDTRRTFRAPPSPPRSPTKADTPAATDSLAAAPAAVFGVVGDTGQTEVTHAVFQHLQAMTDLDVLLHTGDLSYADGFPPRWDSFGRLAEPLMSKLPTLSTPGNHDVTLNGLESTAYHTRYPTPYAASGSASPSWWSLDVGPAHVIGLSSYAPVAGRGMFDGSDSPMLAWLLRDLAGVDRMRTPWLIVMFHVPWYNSNAGHFKEAWRAQAALEDTLYAAGVDVVLNGHVHSYERSHAVRNWAPDPCGAVHLVVGDGGNYEGPYGNRWRQPQPAWSAFREGSFGAGRLEIHNDTHASWEWRRTTCVEAAGATDFNDTWFAPTGDRGVNCRSSNDVSAQAPPQTLNPKP